MTSSESASPSATADRSAGATAGARLAVVVNREGGTVLRLGASQLGARLAAAFAGAGADAELLFVPGAEMDATLRKRANVPSAVGSTVSSSAAGTAASAAPPACSPARACRWACCRSAPSTTSPRTSACRPIPRPRPP